MTVFIWSVTSMQCYPEMDGATDVVFNVRWLCEGVQGEYVARTSGTCNVPISVETFTPYDQLTQEQVLGWVWGSGVNKDETELFVQGQIDQIIAPPVITPPLPWVNSEVVAEENTEQV